MMRLVAAIFGFAGLLASEAQADVRLGAWNIDGVQKSLEALRSNVSVMRQEIGPIDVLIVEEVVSDEQVAVIAEALGLPYWAVSDFSPPVAITGDGFKSLEVGVISRFPIEAAMEWDTTGRLPTGDGFIPRTSDENVVGKELSIDVGAFPNQVSRGFLRVDLASGWSVYAVHWKSSRAQSCNLDDVGFAKERETQAAGVVVDAATVLASGRSVVVGGDFNIQAPGNVLRSGSDSEEDCSPIGGSCDGVCGPGALDGYDDSIHSLLSGLANDATLLTKDVDFTFVASPFPGGAIDHLVVAGPKAKTFTAATTPDVTDTAYHGSDHRPVFSISVEPTAVAGASDRARIEHLLAETRQRLDEIEHLLQAVE